MRTMSWSGTKSGQTVRRKEALAAKVDENSRSSGWAHCCTAYSSFMVEVVLFAFAHSPISDQMVSSPEGLWIMSRAWDEVVRLATLSDPCLDLLAAAGLSQR